MDDSLHLQLGLDLETTNTYFFTKTDKFWRNSLNRGTLVFLKLASSQFDWKKFWEQTQEELERAASSKLDNLQVRTVLTLAEMGRSICLAARRQAISEKASGAIDTIETEVKIPIGVRLKPELGSASFDDFVKTKVETNTSSTFTIKAPPIFEYTGVTEVRETFERKPTGGGGGPGGSSASAGMGDVKLREYEAAEGN